jgi:hypothetical protein
MNRETWTVDRLNQFQNMTLGCPAGIHGFSSGQSLFFGAQSVSMMC